MPTLVLLWVWFCAYLDCAGWALSAIHQLNAGGYAVVLAVWFVALFVWRKKTSTQMFPQIRWQKVCRRFRKPFPLAFLILAAMTFLGGVLYPPSNYDAMAYRVTRVLHWLAADQWHWIHTFFERVNTRACGVEWVSAPFIALLKTDRLLFLISTVSFLMMPGLVFSVFTRLGVRRRVAWHWMWIVPTGYCFVLQAGSIGNDLFGAVFALAALDFALRAKKSGSSRDFFASILAAALMTNYKSSALPLLLPWAIAIFPSLKLALRRPLATAIVCLLALPASLFPMMIADARHGGGLFGMSLEHPGGKTDMVVQTGANVILITSDNFVPPVFPMADKWNNFVANRIPLSWRAPLDQTMEAPGNKFAVRGQMQIEENAGLGFGVSALLLVSVLAAFFVRRKVSSGGGCLWQKCVRWSSTISLLAFMTQSDLSGPGRILTPYYALLIPILLAASGHERLVKKLWWRAAAFAVFLIAAGLVVISPARPLYPIQTILDKISVRHPNSKLLARTETVYSVYRTRNDAFAPAKKFFPPDLKVLGLITFDDPETSLWRPFGSRRIEHVCAGDTAADLKARGIQYILLKNGSVEQWFNRPFADWLKRMNATVVRTTPLELRAQKGAEDWYLVQLQ